MSVILGVEQLFHFDMNIIYKKTSDLSSIEMNQICNVFEQVFGRKKTVVEFKDEFLNTDLGYSFHGMVLNSEQKVVGAQSYIPFSYFVDNTKMLFALSVDTMIMPEYRNFDNIYDLWTLGRKYIKDEGIVFLFGFPNDNSYPLSVTGFGDKDIGNLSTYILPLKIGAVNQNLKYLNFLSGLFCHILFIISSFNRNKLQCSRRVVKDRQTFDKTRFKWFHGDYITVRRKDWMFVYKISEYEGIRTSFLMDVYPMSKQNFDNAVKIMYKRNHKDFDIALYVGHLDFTPFTMIEVPKRFEPKTFHFTGKTLDKAILQSDVIYNIENWEVNLSSYDLL